MLNSQHAPWDTGDLSKGLLIDKGDRRLTDPSSSYNMNMLASPTYYGGLNFPFDKNIKSDEEKAREKRELEMADLNRVIDVWSKLKNNGASESLIQSCEDTIARYIAEIFYLDDKPLR